MKAKWRQTRVDSAGGTNELTGEFKDGQMRFEGEANSSRGSSEMRRATFSSTGPERVRQSSESSTDGGKNWRRTFDYIYVRKHVTSFDILRAPENIENLKWIKLADDPQGDGRNKNSADGKASYYFYDPASDMLWFRLGLYSKVDWDLPAISVSFDTDADQNTGIPWYGANSKFKFDKMLSVGPLEKRDGKYFGYNGITNAEGVKQRDWVNEKSSNLIFYIDDSSNSYIIGVKRSDISPSLHKFNVIGSVGQNGVWNDDIGDVSYATIDLP